MQQKVRYKANLSNESLKVPESRVVADLLLKGVTPGEWRGAIMVQNLLQKRSPATAVRLGSLIKSRLAPMGKDLWDLVKNGNSEVATHATFVAVVNYSDLLGDFLDMDFREQVKLFQPAISWSIWDDFLAGCRERDPLMRDWTEKSERKLGNTIFRILAEAGYLKDTRSLKIQTVHMAPQVLSYLENHNKHKILRCIRVNP